MTTLQDAIQAAEPLLHDTAFRPSVLVMSHSHPQLTRGGAEIAAYALLRGLQEYGCQAWFLGCAGRGSETRLGATLTQPYGADDFVYHPNADFDYFKFANPDPKFPGEIEALVARLRPDIVHAHHYVRFGVEMFAAIRRASPTTRIVVSLHEFLAICHNHGQMVKTRAHRLCERESPGDCATCFPQLGARDFFLRKRYVQTFLEDVDLFVSPSRFLAERYVAWGLPSDKCVVLENMPPEAPAMPSAPAPIPSDTPRRGLRLGFFGQMSPLKGITVLFDAARLLEAMSIDDITIEVHGDYSNQPPDFQVAVEAALADAGTNIVYRGAYDNAQVQVLLRRVDATVVPSIWWENSPVVIQEAFAAGKPVICSDIGGMAEKVRDGVDGLHFEAGRASSLADALARLAREPQLLKRLTEGIQRPASSHIALEGHLKLYTELLTSVSRAA